jgi:hypothetical protein
MAKNGPTCPTHTPNPKRSAAKLKKGIGILAMKKAKMDHVEWTRKHDPLFKVKKDRSK